MKKAICSSFLFCTFLSPTSLLFAQIDGRFFLAAKSLNQQERVWLSKWKYFPGDNGEWAKPEFDDSTWETTGSALEQDHLPQSGWSGIGWFRIHLVVDSALWQQPLVLNISQAGAATIYLDGKLIYDFGDDGSKRRKEQSSRYRDYAVFSFDRKPDHVIAIRYANSENLPWPRATLFCS